MIVALYRFLFTRLLFLMFLFSLCRLLFYLYYSDQFESCTTEQIAKAFLLGLRFDSSIILGANLVFLLFLSIGRFFPIPKSLYILAKLLFVIVNTILITLNVIDLEYFGFTGKRTGIEILGIRADIADQVSQLMLNYWNLVLLSFMLFVWILLRTLRLKYKPVVSKRPVLYFIIGYALFVGVSIIGIRGGFQLKPLRPNVAFTIEPNKLGHVVLNTPFNIFMTYGIEGIQKVSFFKTEDEVTTILTEWNTPKEHRTIAHASKQNVVIIILESFSTEYLGIGNPYQGYTPFLDSLAKTNLYFPNHFANGRVSMEAVPSIMASMPGMMQEPYITSLYQTNALYGLGTLLVDQGYHTSFFHAAKNGSMGFDAFTKNAGFTEYYGLNEYTGDPKNFDSNWGIYDEPYLQYFNQTISQFKEPFASCVFTISSHQPYSIPSEYTNTFLKGDLDIHQTIGYVDQSLKKFFQAASKEAWYANTLFIITADHTHMHSKKQYMNHRGDFNVPLIFFHPSEKLRADTALIVEQIDIMPSIVDYLQIQNPNASLLGQSVFGKQPGHDYAVSFSNNTYSVFLKDFYIEGTPDKSFVIKKYNDTFLRPATKKESEFIQTVIQYYNNGLINNDYYTFGRTNAEF